GHGAERGQLGAKADGRHVGQVVGQGVLALHGRLGAGHRQVDEAVHGSVREHQRRFTSVCITWSCVLIVCAFAWYTRCAVIMLTSSAVMSTLDASVADDCRLPKAPVPGVPTSGWPELELSAQELLPSGSRPFGLVKLASTT